MASFSQSLFLQSLGWATLNSFWQMALLWVLFVLAQHFFRLSSGQKYNLALLSLGTGVAWFVATFLTYYYSGAQNTLLPSTHQLAPTSGTWNIVLSSASIAYLVLLIFPTVRLVNNWQYISRLKKTGLQKTSFEHRLYVKKVARRLGIQKPVHVYISDLISSPLTIGYVKPIILLPVAALNNLTVQQVEAILLHELSHIRRSDFLINLIVNLLHTLLYYNPFVKKFVAAIEAEREKCCDETVLQFEYDKVSYAAALLTLEKNAAAAQALALGAAGKHHLLKRIEKIVGMEKKASFSFTHFAGIMASLLLVIVINSVMFVSKPVEKNRNFSFIAFESPFYTLDRGDHVLTAPPIPEEPELPEPTPLVAQSPVPVKVERSHNHVVTEAPVVAIEVPATAAMTEPQALPFMQVSFNLAEQSTTAEEKTKVEKTVQATKKVLAQVQWQEVEKEIADGMTAREKEHAKLEYMQEIEKIDWKGLEDKLRTQYKALDWEKINATLSSALADIELDSLQLSYNNLLQELEKAEAKSSCGATVLPIPDASLEEIRAIKTQLRSRIDSINVFRNKKVISL